MLLVKTMWDIQVNIVLWDRPIRIGSFDLWTAGGKEVRMQSPVGREHKIVTMTTKLWRRSFAAIRSRGSRRIGARAL